MTTTGADNLPPSYKRVEVLGNLGPNWFASVMGTGIVAIGGAGLPVQVPGLRAFADVMWVIAAVLLVVLIVLVGGHWLRHPTVARGHARNPQMAHFYGAAPMALMTVGGGALLVGKDFFGERIAVDVDWVLWTAGTLGGLFTAVSIPLLMFTRHDVEPDAAFGGWLMPVVPPMVAAATGAMLLPHIEAGTGRQTMLYGCYAMFGLSLLASFNILAMIWSRLVLYGTSGTARVPTLWIVLGPLGQSITAAGLLGTAALHGSVDQDVAEDMNVFAILYGVPVWGFAVLWIALATSLTVRTLRRGMPFALTWWSLTFPVGTFVTGTSQLAAHTHLPAFKVAAAIAYAGLLFTWLLVAVRTARGSVRGNLLKVAPSSAPVKAHKDPAA
jgi:C4-dicarboxylate transporter/malic acid transport protein